ncbi:MAG: adenylate/guanylate cyclase domain-containing response regulator [Leptospirales bacterium]|nr:adenylate/guanylate cyclase domain-containing response regulator [Leptospirales bacterium]
MAVELAEPRAEERMQALLVEPDDAAYYRYSGLLGIWFGEYLQIERAVDLTAGLQLLSSGRFQMAVLEANYPGRSDGRAVVSEIMSNPGASDTPIVILTVDSDPALGLYAIREGVSEFFQKAALDKQVFEYRIRNLLQREFRSRILQSEVSESIERFHHAQGHSQSEITELNQIVAAMKRELEAEYENKIALEKDKNRMQQVFGMYVDPKLVDAILKNEYSVDQKGIVQQVTVLFADIRGYTSLAEKMSPADVIAFLNTYFTAMTEVIMGYGGMIDKYIGDGIMALFGAPSADPEQTENALQAAMEMQMVFELWTPKWEETFGIRPAMGVGVATGEAVVGNVGSFQKISYTAVGDTVNLASRLESLAGPGEVIIPQSLYDRLSEELRRKYTYTARDPVSIKGKSGLYQNYLVSYPV